MGKVERREQKVEERGAGVVAFERGRGAFTFGGVSTMLGDLGRMPEWSNGADCKSVCRRFESGSGLCIFPSGWVGLPTTISHFRTQDTLIRRILRISSQLGLFVLIWFDFLPKVEHRNYLPELIMRTRRYVLPAYALLNLPPTMIFFACWQFRKSYSKELICVWQLGWLGIRC